MVSKFGHCLNDLLFRSRIGALPVEIAAVVSNHTDFAELVASYGIPFHHIPVTKDTKAEAEAQLLELVRDGERRAGRARPLHAGALRRPVQAAAAAGSSTSTTPSCRASRAPSRTTRRTRAGVKLIGATAHYVTADLDEGPIIEQEVERVGHERDAGPAGRDRPGRGVPGAGARGEVARGAPHPAQRPPHGRLRAERRAGPTGPAGLHPRAGRAAGPQARRRDGRAHSRLSDAAANRTSRIASRSPVLARRRLLRRDVARRPAGRTPPRPGRPAPPRGRRSRRRPVSPAGCTSRRRPCPRPPDGAMRPGAPGRHQLARAGPASPAPAPLGQGGRAASGPPGRSSGADGRRTAARTGSPPPPRCPSRVHPALEGPVQQRVAERQREVPVRDGAARPTPAPGERHRTDQLVALLPPGLADGPGGRAGGRPPSTPRCAGSAVRRLGPATSAGRGAGRRAGRPGRGRRRPARRRPSDGRSPRRRWSAG